MTTNYFLVLGAIFAVLALITGRKNSEGIFMPHGGYTYALAVYILIVLGADKLGIQ